jgi:nicotinamidase-related amidase
LLSRNAFVIIDVQKDFIDGTLALKNCPAKEQGNEVVPVINELISQIPFDSVVYTQDWHPADHISFFENLNKRKYKVIIAKF